MRQQHIRRVDARRGVQRCGRNDCERHVCARVHAFVCMLLWVCSLLCWAPVQSAVGGWALSGGGGRESREKCEQLTNSLLSCAIRHEFSVSVLSSALSALYLVFIPFLLVVVLVMLLLSYRLNFPHVHVRTAWYTYRCTNPRNWSFSARILRPSFPAACTTASSFPEMPSLPSLSSTSRAVSVPPVSQLFSLIYR